jgi:hypothetical protein
MSTYLSLLRPALPNDPLIQPQLLSGTFKHTLLDTIFGDEAEDVHLLRLSNTMSMIYRLQIGLLHG